jgi:IS5 family transposase
MKTFQNTYQPGFFDEADKLEKLSKLGDPLVDLKKYIDFEFVRPTLEEALRKERKALSGRPAYDVVFMFKILVLQRLYNISDPQIEYQINDRQSFQRFLGLHLASTVPDYSSVWRFREVLTEKGVIKILFDMFARKLEQQGVITQAGTIVDASFVEVPRQRNTREENERIKNNESPDGWEEKPRMLSQKDLEATWTKKNGVTFYGYKNHIKCDSDSKMITEWRVTTASVHDSQMLTSLVNKDDKVLWGDSAYAGADFVKELYKINPTIQLEISEKGSRNNPLTDEQKASNREKSRTRSRVEHIFGHMTNAMGGMTIRCIGIVRAECTIVIKNLAYNVSRYASLRRISKKTPAMSLS